MIKKPLISVICTSRNDNHGESLNYRTQIFLDCLALQCKTHQIYAELLFVEWNPPISKTRLFEELRWPNSKYLDIRIIEVPEEIHNRYTNSKKIGLYQMMAKNVGIRRARGSFILATNIDIIFSDRIFKSIKEKLHKDTIYTAIRYDIPHNFPDISDRDKIKFAKNNFIRIHLRNYSLPVRGTDIYRLKLFGKLYCLFRIFQIEYKKTSKKSGPSNISLNLFNLFITTPFFLISSFLKLLVNKNRTPKLKALAHHFIDFFYYRFSRKFKSVKSIYNFFWEFIYSKNPHTNACGDFTLCSKEVWLRLRGYPEWDLQSWHLDSLFVHQGNNSGYKTKILAGPIYHIEHSAGSGFTPEYQEILFNRFRENKIPFLSNKDLENLIESQTENDFTVYNNSLWGLKNDYLKERSPIN